MFFLASGTKEVIEQRLDVFPARGADLPDHRRRRDPSPQCFAYRVGYGVDVVGAARALGASFALDSGARWLAFTDADTIVPPDWLAAQLAADAEATCGSVGIEDWSAHPHGMRERFLHGYGRDGEPPIHGANIGLSANAYRSTGGFRPLLLGEDAALVASLVARGSHVAWNASPRVTTSARWESVIEGGFASQLRDLREMCLAELAGSLTVAA